MTDSSTPGRVVLGKNQTPDRSLTAFDVTKRDGNLLHIHCSHGSWKGIYDEQEKSLLVVVTGMTFTDVEVICSSISHPEIDRMNVDQMLEFARKLRSLSEQEVER